CSRRQQRRERAAERRERLLGDPAREGQAVAVEDARAVDHAEQRFQVGRGLVLAQCHDHAGAIGTPERGDDTLARGEPPVVGDAIRERMRQRSIERDVGDDHRVLRWSYSLLASLRSSQAIRLNSWPGLRSRNAGWKVGMSTASPYG